MKLQKRQITIARDDQDVAAWTGRTKGEAGESRDAFIADIVRSGLHIECITFRGQTAAVVCPYLASDAEGAVLVDPQLAWGYYMPARSAFGGLAAKGYKYLLGNGYANFEAAFRGAWEYVFQCIAMDGAYTDSSFEDRSHCEWWINAIHNAIDCMGGLSQPVDLSSWLKDLPHYYAWQCCYAKFRVEGMDDAEAHRAACNAGPLLDGPTREIASSLYEYARAS